MDKRTKAIHLGFENQCLEISLTMLKPTKVISPTIKKSVKYRQILSSVKAIGLVEPIVAIPHPIEQGIFFILDGHLRVEALRDLSIEKTSCLISKDDEGFTYNKSVSRLSAVQEYRMIVHVHEDGVPAGVLAAALGISEQTIRDKFRLLDGICDEAINLLADKPAPRGMFAILKKMTAFRQIDVVQTMINLNNYSTKLALAMFHATPPDELVDDGRAKTPKGNVEVLHRLERELAAVQADTKLIEESYGPANLQLTIIKTHIKGILENARVVRWLLKFHREYLEQLQLIADMKNSSSQ